LKHTITYSRKVRTGEYETMEIGWSKEFDETTPVEEAFAEVKDQVEKWIHEELSRIESEKLGIPEFDPQVLLEHEWKGRKRKDSSGYEKGSLSWGWDFASEFPESVIKVLRKGPLTIEGYEFSLDTERNLVHTKKADEK